MRNEAEDSCLKYCAKNAEKTTSGEDIDDVTVQVRRRAVTPLRS
jgi:hypothetical protein